ncbi:hypothetical protein OEA41_004677 [Lepraria neglecta]|uniref:Uncharacterized protein n=1 Tax=Lepraria neglecta TaxID=209136 RepID=A0AAD9YZL5_9LECA|nr:hypothetical protein OEA41_004677 [Lepraria neglecta]
MPTPAVDEQAIPSWLSSFDLSASQNFVLSRWEPRTGTWLLESPESLIGRVPKEGFYGFTALRWANNKTAGSRPNRRSLAVALESILIDLEEWTKNVSIVLDALDECPTLSDQIETDPTKQKVISERGDMLDWITGPREKHLNAHILATSRNEVGTRSFFHDALAVNLEDSLTGDVETFITSNIEKMVRRDPWKENCRTKALTRIVTTDESRGKIDAQTWKLKLTCDRRFRWAYLQMRELSDCVDVAQLEAALASVPETLEKAYEKALSRIPKRHMEQVRIVLTLLGHFLRRLTPEEVAAAVMLPEPRDVLRICPSSMVTTVQFDGYNPDGSGRKDFVCVSRWLETNDDEMTKGKLLDIPLIRYSTLWYRHVQAADQFAARSATCSPEKRQTDDKSLTQIESLRLALRSATAAAARKQTSATVDLLLQHRGDAAPIEALSEAAQNDIDGARVMNLLLSRRDEERPVISLVVEMAATNNNYALGILEAILQHDGDIAVNDWVMLAAATNSLQGVLMKFLVTLKGPHLPITETIVEVIQESCWTSQSL